MVVTNTITETRYIVGVNRKTGKRIGLVPTMGYLHRGHCSLIRRARKENDFVVVSIFVNPTQFGLNEDFSAYPRDFERDKNLCFEAGTDLIFYPSINEIYPKELSTYVYSEKLTNTMCGAFRPGHFRGVATVVCKLFNIVQPDSAYFGEKDVQQLTVINRMTEDLNFPIKIVSVSTVREKDGLAMSSRNSYLSDNERKSAVVLIKSLMAAKDLIKKGERNAAVICKVMNELIAKETLAGLEYIAIVDKKELQPLQLLTGDVLIALAVKIGKTRLIDNMSFKIEKSKRKFIHEAINVSGKNTSSYCDRC